MKFPVMIFLDLSFNQKSKSHYFMKAGFLNVKITFLNSHVSIIQELFGYIAREAVFGDNL